MTECKSPTHKRYRDAAESMYIHLRIAQQDLDSLMLDASLHDTSHVVGQYLVLNQHRIEKVEERLAFARQQWADAQQAVDAHFTRGCRNLDRSRIVA